eukprot:5670453-Alexandrium_andersonii.AAC.1
MHCPVRAQRDNVRCSIWCLASVVTLGSQCGKVRLFNARLRSTCQAVFVSVGKGTDILSWGFMLCCRP